MPNSKGRELFLDFISLSGIEDADEVLSEAALLSVDLSQEMGDASIEVSNIKAITGLCLLHIGLDEIITDWGWQDPEDGAEFYDEKLRNTLSRYVMKTYMERIRKSYLKQKEKANETSKPQ